MNRQPQFTQRTIHSPLWIESANDLKALAGQRTAKRQRRLSILLLVLAIITTARFIAWLNF